MDVEVDEQTQARNRMVFAVVGGVLALTLVVLGLLAMVDISSKSATQARPPHSAQPVLR